MSELTFELFEIEADETSVLECKFGQFIVGAKGEQGPMGPVGPDGSLRPADIALLAAATASAQNSASASKDSATQSAASAAAAAGSASSSAANATNAQNSAVASKGSADAASASAAAAAGNASASANSAGQSAASATAASGSAATATTQANLAKDWATKTPGTVDGVDYSAKYYAQQTISYANAAAGSASAAAGSAAAAAQSALDAANSAATVDTTKFVMLDGSRAMTAPLKTPGLAPASGPLTLSTGGAVRYTIDAAGNHSLSGPSASFAVNTAYFNGPTQAVLAFQKAGVLRYVLGWDGGNFTCNRYNASGAYLSTPWYVRDADGALICGAPITTTSLNMTGTLTNTGNAIELGPVAAGPAYIDMHCSGNAVDYDARIIATGGNATVGNGTLDLYGGSVNQRTLSGFSNFYSSTTLSVIRLFAGGYAPMIRSNSGNSAIEFVNSANSAVNATFTDAGGLSLRASMTSAGIYNNGGLQQSGQLWMVGANSIRLDGGSYSGFLRGDSSGLVGFINQAQNNWTMQIKDSGQIWCSNQWQWGDTSNIGGQYAGTGSTGGHTERNAIIQQSDNVNMYLSHTGGGGTMIWFGVVGANVGSISCSTSATSYNTASDYRLKTNIEALTGGLDRVLQMRPVAFDWKANGESSRGFIAHELEPIEPDAVTGVKDAMMQDRANPEGPEIPAYQQVDLSFCIPDMVAAMQELKSQLDAALARIATLEGAAPA